MDSLVCAALAAERHDELFFLHLNYGQRTEERERKAYHDIAAHYGAETLEVDVSHLARIGGSALTEPGIAVPEGGDTGGVPTTYVPFRNANILAIAVSWAEVIGADTIYFGAVEEDSSGYPDCRQQFVDAYNRAIKEGTKPSTHITVTAPLIHMSKQEIVEKAHELGAPLGLSWSCYQSNGPKACGRCASCRLRLKGFMKAGLSDPVRYER